MIGDDDPVDGTFLRSIGVNEEHLQRFKEAEIDNIGTLKWLDKDDLEKLGLPLGPCKKILHALTSSS